MTIYSNIGLVVITLQAILLRLSREIGYCSILQVTWLTKI